MILMMISLIITMIGDNIKDLLKTNFNQKKFATPPGIFFWFWLVLVGLGWSWLVLVCFGPSPPFWVVRDKIPYSMLACLLCFASLFCTHTCVCVCVHDMQITYGN